MKWVIDAPDDEVAVNRAEQALTLDDDSFLDERLLRPLLDKFIESGYTEDVRILLISILLRIEPHELQSISTAL